MNVPDTTFPAVTVQRSGEDSAYVNVLMNEGFITRDFVRDVLMVDFTRPVLSDDRCDLLERIPDSLEPTAEGITNGVLEVLRAASPESGTPAAQLLQNLEQAAAGTPINAAGITRRFYDACDARQLSDTISVNGTAVSAVHADGMKLRSLGRKIVYGEVVLDGSASHQFPVFEFAQSMTTDAIQVAAGADPRDLMTVDPNARLHPLDCTLVNQFIPIPSEATQK